MGLSGRSRAGEDAATKAGLLDLLEEAVDAGCRCAGPAACSSSPSGGRTAGSAAVPAVGSPTSRPGGSPMHGLLPEEAEAILALFDEWGETDRSHRKLAHRSSYLLRVFRR